MVGNSQTAKAYRLLDPDNQNIVERDILFEKETSRKSNIIGTWKNLVEFLQTQKHNEFSSNSAISELDDEEIFGFSDQKSSENDTSQDAEPQARGHARPRIIRTGQQGRPRKQLHSIESKIP